MIIKAGTFLELLPRGARILWQAQTDTEVRLIQHDVLEFIDVEAAPACAAVSALLTKREAARQAGVSYQAIRTWLKRGLPRTRVGNQVFIDSLKLMQWCGNSAFR